MAFVTDTFTDTNGTILTSHTGETGATWTKVTGGLAGDLDIQSNQLRDNTSGTGCEAYTSGVPGSAEYDVEADLLVNDTSRGEACGITGRCSTSARTFYLGDHLGDTNTWRLFKCVAGAFTSLGSFGQNLVNTTTYHLKLELRDAAKKVYIDSVERISSADNAITAAGRAGVRIDGSVAADNDAMRLDNFSATDAGGAAAVTYPQLERGIRGVNRGVATGSYR